MRSGDRRTAERLSVASADDQLRRNACPPRNRVSFYQLRGLTHIVTTGSIATRAPCASCACRSAQNERAFAYSTTLFESARVKRRDSLYRPGDAQLVYAIRLGTFKTLMLGEDGREQITGCYMNGEIVGLDGIGDGRHTCGAVALEDSEVCALSFDQLGKLAHDTRARTQSESLHLEGPLSRPGHDAAAGQHARAEERLVGFCLTCLAATGRAATPAASSYCA